MRYQARDALLHRILPFLLVALLLIISAILAIFASPYLGGAAFFGTLAGVVGVYLKGAMDSGKQSAAAPGSEVVGSSGHPPPR